MAGWVIIRLKVKLLSHLSMKTHIGKIGRLKSIIRDELNQRIEDGQTGVEILSWLNGLSEVQRVLQE